MMGQRQLFLSLLAILACSGLALGRGMKSMESIVVNNPYVSHDDDGHWGQEEHCPIGQAFAFAIKYEEPGSSDQTAVNAVKLYCRDGQGVITGDITSFEGQYGKYLGVRYCPNFTDKMTGFRLRVWPYQGTFGDDWAVDNVQISCSSNVILDGMGEHVSKEQINADNRKFPAQSISEHMEVIDIPIKSQSLVHGDWTNWAYCSKGYYICGLITLVEEGHIFSDDAGLVDMRMYCSNL